jgi:IstB-like ATP binding protein
VLLTTNLPFSEWTQVIPNARLCKALLDRITDRAHIIETGSDSYRFRRTLELRGRHGRSKTTNGLNPNPQLSTEKSSSPGPPVQKRDDYDDGGSAAELSHSTRTEESLTVPA